MTRGSHNVIVTVTRPELAPGQSFAEWLAAHPNEARGYRQAMNILAAVTLRMTDTPTPADQQPTANATLTQ